MTDQELEELIEAERGHAVSSVCLTALDLMLRVMLLALVLMGLAIVLVAGGALIGSPGVICAGALLAGLAHLATMMAATARKDIPHPGAAGEGGATGHG